MKINPSVGNCFIFGLIMIVVLLIIAAFSDTRMLILLIPVGVAIAVLRKSIDNWIKANSN